VTSRLGRTGVLALAALGVALIAVSLGTVGALGAIGMVALILSAYPFLRALPGKQLDPFEPIYLFVVYLALTMFARGLLDLTFGSPLLDPVLDTRSVQFRQLMGLVFGYSCLFLLALYVGYYSRLGELVTRPLPRIPTIHLSKRYVWGLGVLSLLMSGFAAWVLYGRIGGAVEVGEFFAATRQGGVYWAAYCLRFALVGGVIAYAHASQTTGRRGMLLTAGYAMLVGLGMFLFFPTKGTIANVILALLVCTHYLRRRVGIGTLVGALLLGLFLLPLLMVYRNLGLQPGQIVAMAKSLPGNPWLMTRGLIERTYGADSFAMILDTTARTGHFEFGRTFLDMFWWYVPRALWPQKPLTYSIEFGQTFLSQSGFYRGRSVSASPSLIGELYLNFSWPGILLGGLITGIVLRGAYVFFVRRGKNSLAVVLYGVWLAGCVGAVEGPLADHIEDTFITFVIAGLLLLLANVAFPNAARDPRAGQPRLGTATHEP